MHFKPYRQTQILTLYVSSCNSLLSAFNFTFLICRCCLPSSKRLSVTTGNTDVFNFRSCYPKQNGKLADRSCCGVHLVVFSFWEFSLKTKPSLPFCHVMCVCVWEALNPKGLSNTCLPLLYKSIFWNKRKVKTRKSKQKIQESEREIRRECSEAWNEFHYSINKSWGELYRFIVQPTLKSPGISVPGSAGIQRAQICQHAMRQPTAERISSLVPSITN